MAPKATTPARFAAYLAERWAEGHKSARHLLPELKARSYAGSQTHLERLLGQWRRADHAGFLRDLAGGSTTYRNAPFGSHCRSVVVHQADQTTDGRAVRARDSAETGVSKLCNYAPSRDALPQNPAHKKFGADRCWTCLGKVESRF
jgi:hypothetical protein